VALVRTTRRQGSAPSMNASTLRALSHNLKNPIGRHSAIEQAIKRLELASHCRHAAPWARAGYHRFPGDPSYAFALL